MSKKLTYRGSPCTKDCGGHKAGFAYGRSGGSTPSPSSPSFNKGMNMAKKASSTRKKRKK